MTTTKCKRFNTRCQCTQCKPKYYSEDCSKACPEPAVSILLDSIFIPIAAWCFFAYLYYTNRDAKEMDDVKETQQVADEAHSNTKEVLSRATQAVTTNAAKRVGKKVRALQRLLIMRLQIIASILTSMVWSPDVPQFLINSLNFITGFFTVKIPGLLTSLDCVGTQQDGSGMTPIVKWLFSLLSNFFVMIILFLWWKVLPSNSIAKRTVEAASLQVFFIWIFENLVTTCFQILDCTTDDEPLLILDPSVKCSDIGAYQNFGGLTLFVYIFVPYAVFAFRTNSCKFFCCCCSCCKISGKNHQARNPIFFRIFGWALGKFI